LDKTNIEKNRQHKIEPPMPVPNFQALISGVITPKISAITQTFGSLSSGVLGGSAGSSGSLSGGSTGGSSSTDDDGESTGGGSQAGGLGGILSSVLRLSGPILSASLGGGAGSSGSSGFDSTTEADDDF
jgi:hypothetical protein